MNAQDRRRERRAAKQAEWKQANPLLVGVKAKPTCRPILTLNRKPVDRVVKAVDTETEYYKQIQAAAEKYTGPDMPSGAVCLPAVAIYSAGYRKPTKSIYPAR